MVGRPRRVAAASRMSSWTSEPICTSSTAAAAATTRSSKTSPSAAQAMVNRGRIRLPPASATRTLAGPSRASSSPSADVIRSSTAANRSARSAMPNMRARWSTPSWLSSTGVVADGVRPIDLSLVPDLLDLSDGVERVLNYRTWSKAGRWRRAGVPFAPSVDVDRLADGGDTARLQHVHGRVRDAGTAVRRRVGGDAARAVDGDAAVEVLRSVQRAEGCLADPVDLAVDREAAGRGDGAGRPAGGAR